MTQALANNYNNLNEALVKDTGVMSAVTKPDDFTKILDTKITDKQTSFTIGDIKRAAINNDSETMSDLRTTITDALNEANMENTLDLTLARDVKDIIKQLKESLKLNIEMVNAEEENTGEQADDVLISEVDTEMSEDVNEQEEKPAFNELLMAAVQILAPQVEPVVQEVAEQAEKFVNNAISKIDIQTDTEILEQETIDLAAKVLPEGVENEDCISEDAEPALDKDMLKELNVESIESETNTNNGNEFANRQSAEEYGIKAMIQHTVENVNVNFDNIQTQTIQPKTVEITPDKVMEQIVKHMENLHNGSKVNIVLNPESLGKVNLQIINTKEGMSAQFTVTTQEARDLIMKGLEGLKENLLAHGVNVDNISVRVSETEKESYNPDWTEQEGSRGGNKEQGQQNREEKEKGLFEKTLAETFKENGNV